MNHNPQKFSFRAATNIFLIFGAALLITSCAKNPPVPPATEAAKTVEKAPAPKPDTKVEENLLKEQIHMYHQLGESYRRAAFAKAAGNIDQLNQLSNRISLLNKKLVDLEKQFDACPAEAKQLAQAAVKEPWERALKRYELSKNQK